MTTSGYGSLGTAQLLWNDYENSYAIQPEEKSAVVLETLPKGSVAVFDRCVSLNQGHRARIGNLCNSVVAKRYGDLLNPWLIKTETRIRVGNKRDIDLLFIMPKADLYVSVTTIPQERKDETWVNEYSLVEQTRRFSGETRPFYFVPLFFVGDSKTRTVEKTIKVREKKQALMPRGVTVVAAHDVAHHAAFLSSLLADLV